jgi:Flp pilus assembly protein TadD
VARIRVQLAVALIATAPLLCPHQGTARAESSPGAGLRCEFGVSQALAGHLASAESAFVAVLGIEPDHAAALNGLGNLHLLRGDLDLALASYLLASRADSADAGIRLNQGIAVFLQGDADSARALISGAIRGAGGPGNAARLLGFTLRDAEPARPKAADKPQVSREEVRALLLDAARNVPRPVTTAPDSLRRRAGKAETGRPPMRSGGTRAADGSDLGSVLYWKH